MRAYSHSVTREINPLPAVFVREFRPIIQQADAFLLSIQTAIESGNYANSDEILVQGNALKSEISKLRHNLQDRIQKEDSNLKVALLYLSTLQETQEIISHARHLLRADKRFMD